MKRRTGPKWARSRPRSATSCAGASPASPRSTQSLLQVAAVSGREFDIDLVATVCDLDIDNALDDLDPALVTGVVGDSDVARSGSRTHS